MKYHARYRQINPHLRISYKTAEYQEQSGVLKKTPEKHLSLEKEG